MCIEFEESVFRCVYYYTISADCLVIIGQPPYGVKIFYTADREDFDNEMIYTELEDVDVELHFDAGEVVERIFEVIE